MSLTRLLIVTLFTFTSHYCEAQRDSTVHALQQLPAKYITKVDSKIDKYSSRITSKTEKTLAKLSRWENKIHSLLLKVNPDAAAKLFGNDQTTFSNVLQKIKEGKAVVENYRAQYDSYRDKLTTDLKYLEQQKDNVKNNLVKPINEANKKIAALEDEVKKNDEIEQFIKQRKKQLLDEAVKYIGNSKYLAKINKEAYYYVETMRNYKEIFSDQKKAEETAFKILNNIPAFQKFMEQNSQLASLFGIPSRFNDPQSLVGLQTRASVQDLIQNRIAAGGPNAQALISQNLQAAHAQLDQLKDKVLKAGASSSDAELPNFKPNVQKSKTFLQRLEYGSNFQFTKANSLLPTTADIGLNAGYKLNNKSIIGIGASYKMGLGSIQHISITHQGIGLRSYLDWKIKKQFYATGGFEMNHNAQFKNISELKSYSDWQQSGLIGLSKKINVKTKWFRGTQLQLLYDMLYRSHIPVSPPVLFRIGYSFKN